MSDKIENENVFLKNNSFREDATRTFDVSELLTQLQNLRF